MRRALAWPSFAGGRTDTTKSPCGFSSTASTFASGLTTTQSFRAMTNHNAKANAVKPGTKSSEHSATQRALCIISSNF